MKLLVCFVSLSAATLLAEPVGLVLSGGGAKGAYEVGVWKAMVEVGVARDVRVISGTSVGAMNGALFASVKDPAKIESLWMDRIGLLMGPFVDGVRTNLQEGLCGVADQMRLRGRYIDEGKRRFATERGILVEDLLPSEIDVITREADVRVASGMARQMVESADRLGNMEPLDGDAYRRMLFAALPKDWKDDAPDVYVTAVAKMSGRARSFLLNRESEDRRVDAIMASCAFPKLFKPVVIDGLEYIDGGCLSYGGDNTPIGPILANHPEVATVVVVYLDDEKRLGSDRVDKGGCKGKNVIEIIPSQDSQGLLGCVNSDAERAKSLVNLGYRDAIAVLKAVKKIR